LKLWTAQTISVFGDRFSELAIPLIAVLMLGATPGQMGILTAVTRAPFLLIGMFAGVWVDRLPRRPILITGDLGRAIVLLSIPLAAVLGSLSMLHLYTVGSWWAFSPSFSMSRIKLISPLSCTGVSSWRATASWRPRAPWPVSLVPVLPGL